MKKYIVSVLFVLSCLLLFTSCSQEVNRVASDPEGTLIGQEEQTSVPVSQVKTAFTKEELLADYDQCWDLLEVNYPFFPVLEKHGIDVQGVKESYRQTLMERVTDANGLYTLLQQMFVYMEGLAHLGVMPPQVVLSLQYGPEMQNQSDLGPREKLFHDAQTIATYNALLEFLPDASGNLDHCIETRYYPDLKAAHIHFKTFSYPEEENSVVGEYLAQLEDEECPVDHVIIDITGNGGGDIYNVIHDAIAPLGGGSWSYTYYFADSPVNQEMLLPTFEYLTTLGYHYDVGVPQKLTGAPTEPAFTKELGMTHSLECTIHFPGLEKTYAENAHRWLLIDRCYSAAEGLSSFCKDSGWATVVGRRGKGDGDFLSPFAVRLDQTGLLVWFSTTTKANTDGSLNAEIGSPPDYLCRPSESPLRKCMALIEDQSESNE